MGEIDDDIGKQLDQSRAQWAMAIATLEAIHKAAGSPMKGQCADPIETGAALLSKLTLLQARLEKAEKLCAEACRWADELQRDGVIPDIVDRLELADGMLLAEVKAFRALETGKEKHSGM